MPTTTAVLEIATSTTTLAGSMGSYDFLKDIVAPIAVGTFLMLLERWFGLTKILVREGKTEQNITRKIKSRLFIFGSHNTVNVNSGNQEGYSATGDGTRVATPEDAQRPIASDNQASRPTIIRDGFILDSISALITDETTKLQIRADYEQSFSYLENEPKGAATLFTRAFGPVVQAVRGRGHTQDADLLQVGVSRLSQLGLDGTSRDEVSDTATNVHRVLHLYFQNHRP